MELITILRENWQVISIALVILVFILVNLKFNRVFLIHMTGKQVPIFYSGIEMFIEKPKDSKNSSASPKIDLNKKENASRILFLNLSLEQSEERQVSVITDYFETLKSYIDNSKETIIVLDSIGHYESMISSANLKENRNKDLLEMFYNEYFRHIEDFLEKNKNIKYHRILMLPPLPAIYRDTYQNLKKYNDAPDATDYLAKLLYKPTKNHIERMFKANQNLPANEQFKLFFLEDPIRSISEIIIDNKYWITEIDVHNNLGISFPDRLFINEVSTSQDAILINKEIDLIRETLRNHPPITNIESFQSLLSRIYEYSC